MTPTKFILVALLLGACGSSGGKAPPGAPTITTQPGDQSVAVGSSATFSVVASGSSLTYQWQRNDAPIAGETAATLTLTNPALTDSGTHFRVVVTNSAGSVTSNEALLTVTSSSGSATLTLHTSGGAGQADPPFLAFQDGDGPWQTIAPNGTGVYTLTVTADRYGVAVGDDTTDPTKVKGFLFQATVSELPEVDLPFAPVPAVPRYQATATFVDIPDAGSAQLHGCGSALWDESPTIKCQMPAGYLDGLASDNVGDYVLLRHQGVIAQTNPNVYSDVGTYGFNGVSDFRMVDHTFTIHGNPPNSGVRTECGIVLPFGDTETMSVATNAVGLGGVPASTDSNGDAVAKIQLLPSSLVLPRDVQYAFVQSRRAASPPDVESLIYYTTYFNASSDLTVSLPDSFPFASYVVESMQPYPRLGAQWTPTSALPLYVISILGPNAAGNAVSWYCHVSGNWLKGAPQSQYAFPDLSAVSGWSSHFALGTGADNQAFLSLSAVSSVDLRKANLASGFYFASNVGLPPVAPQAGDNLTFVSKSAVYISLP